MSRKLNTIFFSILAIIFIACSMLWLWSGYPVTHISSDDGTRDLCGADFSSGSFDLHGTVEYIPNALLTPEEFAARQNEIKIGSPENEASHSTSRLRIFLPNGTYGLMLNNAELATNIFINGEPIESVGVPGSDEAYNVPDVKLLYYTCETKNGVIEIVQQASSFALCDAGGHSDIVIGNPGTIRDIYNRRNTMPAVVMGCFLTLALAHLVLYSLLRVYKANLLFALFCLVWLIRIGVTSPWIFMSDFNLSTYAAIRLSFAVIPLGLLLSCLTFHAMFPGILQKWFRVALSASCGAYACVCLFANTLIIEDALNYFRFIVLFTIIYTLVRLCMKLRRPSVEQAAFLTGLGIFFATAVRDLVPATVTGEVGLSWHAMSDIGLLVYVFFQMAAMFRGTMREVAASKEAEQRFRLEAETERRISTMKSEFLGELSHELRMPISAISGYAQYLKESIEDETPDKGAIRESARWVENEAERIDRLVSQLLDMAAIEAGRFTLKKETVSVKELFERIQYGNIMDICVHDGVLVFLIKTGDKLAIDKKVYTEDAVLVKKEYKSLCISDKLCQAMLRELKCRGAELAVHEFWVYPDGHIPAKRMFSVFKENIFIGRFENFYRDFHHFGYICPICGKQCVCAAEIYLAKLPNVIQV